MKATSRNTDRKAQHHSRRICHFLSSEDGATAVEYSVLLALILMAVIGAIGSVGAETGGLWSDINSDLDSTPFGGS